MLKPNFSAQIEQQNLEALRALAKQLGLTIIYGPFAGKGSIQQLMNMLAVAKIHDHARLIAALKPIAKAQR